MVEACSVEYNIALFIKEFVAYNVEPDRVEYNTVDACNVDCAISVFVVIVDP